jgi:pyruvate dehydrogenase E2 component (dihydrolipoamide acetyltransferase)
MTIQVTVPDVGDASEVEVIEILVAVGDTVAKEDSLVVLESDKASMEIPSPYAGKVAGIAVKVGDTVGEGSLILELEGDNDTAESSGSENAGSKEAEAENSEADGSNLSTDDAASEAGAERLVPVPDVGDASEVTVTEILVKVGDVIAADDSLVVLESDKASMEIPSPYAGKVLEILVQDGAVVGEGDPLVRLMTQATGQAAAEQKTAPGKSAEPPAASTTKSQHASARLPVAAPQVAAVATAVADRKVHAGPAVRKQAREYGVQLAQVKGTGQQGRVLKEDVQAFVQNLLQQHAAGEAGGAAQGAGIPPMPAMDFSKFGEIERQPLSRVRRSSARNLHRSWLNIPHADITELEAFRKSQNAQLTDSGDKLTPLAFLIKACVHALVKFPQFNASIEPDYEHRVLKKYYNIGIAVETPDGLVVPVVRDADKKGLVDLARETAQLASLARDKKLPLDAMQGASFSISSLGGIGGTAFTPIVNAPEVAILGVSRSAIKPVWDGQVFVPRLLLPLSLSYDHRAIDGAEAARFTTHLAYLLADVRRLIL